MTTCCFAGALTREEREATARLRERRAQGRAPPAVAHRAVPEKDPMMDPLVSFYKPKKPSPPLSSPPARARVNRSPPTHQLRQKGHLPHMGGHSKQSPVRPPQFRTAHAQKTALRRAARLSATVAQVATGGGTAARQADASASGAMTVRRIRGHGVGVEMGEKKNGRRAAFVKVAGGKEKKRETSSHGMDNDGEGGRGGGGIVQAMKGLSVWNMLRERERQRDPASEKTSEASSSEQEEPKSDGAKAKVDKCIGEYGKEERCVDRSMQRICDATKRRLEGVRKRLAGEQDMPERFVLKKGEGRVREPLSGEGRDAPDCSNDKYFQELMNSEA